MDVFLESFKAEWNSFIQISPKLIIAIIVLALSILIGKIFSKGFSHLLSRANFKPTHRNFFKNLIVWLFGIIGLFIALNIMGLNGIAASLLAGGGITAVALGFAFRGIGENLLAGFFLAFSRPFDVGDLIQSGEFQGIVKGIELRSTHIRSADGRDIYIPSSQIFGEVLINYTRDGLRRLSFKVGIDYGDDSLKARELLYQTTSEIDFVLSDPIPSANIATMTDQYVQLEVAFWVDTFQQGINMVYVQNEVMEKCRLVLLQNGFTFSSNVVSNIALVGSEQQD